MVGASWAVAVRLPLGVCADSFAAGMRAEGLPCEPGRADGVVYVALCPSYSAEDTEHLVLGVAKVAHYLAEALTLPSPLPRAGEGVTRQTAETGGRPDEPPTPAVADRGDGSA